MLRLTDRSQTANLSSEHPNNKFAGLVNEAGEQERAKGHPFAKGAQVIDPFLKLREFAFCSQWPVLFVCLASTLCDRYRD
jgi:hypothetical protein